MIVDEATAGRLRNGMQVNVPELRAAPLVKVFSGPRELLCDCDARGGDAGAAGGCAGVVRFLRMPFWFRTKDNSGFPCTPASKLAGGPAFGNDNKKRIISSATFSAWGG